MKEEEKETGEEKIRGQARPVLINLLSVRTSYASATSLNLSSAPGCLFLSGWYLSAIFRYAFLISFSSAERDTPRIL